MSDPNKISVKPELILFDLGRVLADLGSPSARMRLDITDAEFWNLWLSMPIVKSLERGDTDPEEFLPVLAQRLGIQEDPIDFRQRFLDWQPRLYASTELLIPFLASECRLALLSNTNSLHWELVRSQTSIFRYFEHLFLSYEIRRIKPEREAFDRVLISVSTSPASILFLDDMKTNIFAARQLGIRSKQVNGIVETMTALSESGFDIDGIYPGH